MRRSQSLHLKSYYLLQTKLQEGNVFTPVCQSFCSQRRGDLCMMSLPVWLPGPMFLLGVSVSRSMFLLGGLCLGGLPDRDSPGQRPPWTETTRPPYGKERAVRILLERILVSSRIYVCTQPTGKINAYNTYSLAITGTIFKFSKRHEESHREKLTSHLAAH